MARGGLIDETGNRYGKLVVVERAANIGISAAWVCKCDCGGTHIAVGAALRRGKTWHCGCGDRPFIDETGNKYGRWTVLKKAVHHGRHVAWLCRCLCGNEKVIPGTTLRNGGSKSCGCLRGAIPRDNKSIINRIYYQQKKGAEVRDIPWKITKKEMMEIMYKDCFYCGSPPITKESNRSKNNELSLMRNGMDRVDNNLGYVSGNVVPCCKWCNIAKSTRSVDDFKSWIVNLYKKTIKPEITGRPVNRLKCKKCGHEWIPRTSEEPARCPSCCNDWRTPYKNRSRQVRNEV